MSANKPGRNIQLSEAKDAVIRDLFAQGAYDVSETGEVTNLVTGRVLKSSYLGSTGFLAVTIRTRFRNYRTSVHRLVALRHLPVPPRYMEVDHLNGIKDDNRLENLCWATHQENIRRDFEAGRNNIGATGERGNSAVLTDREALAILRISATGKLNPVEIAECFDISTSLVRALLRARCRKVL